MAGPGRSPEPGLLPGALVGAGRYRLLEALGTDPAGRMGFWRARDGQLGREVALTVLAGPPGPAQVTLERVTRAAGFVHPGTARILDVLAVGEGVAAAEPVAGIVAAAWTRGQPVRGPVPVAQVGRLMAPLAAAVAAAHQAGLVLGLDGPRRLRVAPEGGLRLAFPGPPPGLGARDDIVGLGGSLYLLLTGYWPGPAVAAEAVGLPRDERGAVPPPQALVAGVPAALSGLAWRCVHEPDTLTAAAVAAELEALAAGAGERQGEPDREPTTVTIAAAEPSAGDAGEGDENGAEEVRPARRRSVVGMVLLTVATLAVAAWVGDQVLGYFTVAHTKTPDVQPARAVPAPPERVQPTGVVVYNVAGDADRADTANRAIDGDPTTGWRTDNYFQNFPIFKPGIGLVVTFPRTVTLNQVTITSPSGGATVEIRTAPSDNPDLDQTNAIGQATLAPGDTRIPLQKRAPTQRILVWITGLAGGGDRWSAEIDELAFTATR
ncbi:hypothetical protein [Gandjariella thermophila]|uniref:hypothetical protein n=1 Tax=Gandjariella thermophila TaxID=1931992 RepID=UPI0010F9FE7F|nr:hypothetical protein [Gandjariella thermophila]